MKTAFLITGAMLLFIVGVIYLEVGLWRECRADHSWLYCVRVLGK